MFFSHMNNLLMPGRGVNMGDGWETKRNRTPNNRDWVIVRLAHKGIIKKALIDTCHFKGNYPDSFTLEGCMSESDDLSNAKWTTIIERTKLQAHHEHQLRKGVGLQGTRVARTFEYLSRRWREPDAALGNDRLKCKWNADDARSRHDGRRKCGCNAAFNSGSHVYHAKRHRTGNIDYFALASSRRCG
jgi:hypothetical protein